MHTIPYAYNGLVDRGEFKIKEPKNADSTTPCVYMFDLSVKLLLAKDRDSDDIITVPGNDLMRDYFGEHAVRREDFPKPRG